MNLLHTKRLHGAERREGEVEKAERIIRAGLKPTRWTERDLAR